MAAGTHQLFVSLALVQGAEGVHLGGGGSMRVVQVHPRHGQPIDPLSLAVHTNQLHLRGRHRRASLAGNRQWRWSSDGSGATGYDSDMVGRERVRGSQGKGANGMIQKIWEVIS